MSVLKSLPLAGLLLALGLPAAVQAQGIELINRCDRVCAASPKAICYQACFAGGIPAYQKKPPQRPQPLSVLRAQEADWKPAVYNHSFNSRGGTGGGGGSKGK